jgi:hypothetical protein
LGRAARTLACCADTRMVGSGVPADGLGVFGGVAGGAGLTAAGASPGGDGVGSVCSVCANAPAVAPRTDANTKLSRRTTTAPRPRQQLHHAAWSKTKSRNVHTSPTQSLHASSPGNAPRSRQFEAVENTSGMLLAVTTRPWPRRRQQLHWPSVCAIASPCSAARIWWGPDEPECR